MIGKLLVVDDEIWFREGLVQLISSNQLGWEVVGEASDGEEAMQAVELYKPDLIITDINMPAMDGLQLMEWLSRAYPEIRVIILTGYRDFEYAQRALRYGAVEFLLKPFSLDEAYHVLRKSYEELRLKQLEVRVMKQERQTELFRAALFGLPCERTLREEWEQKWQNAEICILQVHSYNLPEKNYTPGDISLLHYAVTNILQELLQVHQAEGIYFPLRTEAFAFLLEPGSAGAEYRRAVQEAVHRYIGLATGWLVIGTVERFEQLAEQYNEAREGLADGRASEVSAVDGFLPLKEELLSLLVTSNLAAAEQRLTEYLETAAPLGLQSCKTKIYTLVTVFASILLTDFKHLNAAAASEGLSPARILEMRSVPELLSWAQGRSTEFLDIFRQWLGRQQDNVVVQAKQYIEAHYQDDCSLQTIAAYVHVTPNYLSNLFKKETGTGLTNYVSQLRIEEAKLLLQHTRLRMTEIAERVGFDNSSYFTVVFKQLTGESPREFRRRYE
ncbi:response regulator [Paenibacillus sp. MMS20-IR301]|uniref:response regulator n=1 Tax=Paenibacillus sp. MMS20-IR301 TaxID=2895946 RepID=UPI0028E57360|nr:response regulator [Paenibacillus sp. MMS20-IR301]WNS42349.1 response regulator [Paenibacillus sp. MMS20-IR301]